MKTLRFKFVILMVFCLFTLVNTMFAQEPFGKLVGNVADNRGPVSNARVIVRLKNSQSYPQTRFTDQDGNFTFFALRLGTYDVVTQSDCMSSKSENIQLASKTPLNLNIKLVYENCEEKAAEEDREWKACEQEVNITGLDALGFDKAKAINEVLMDFLKDETGNYFYQGESIAVSAENINREWISFNPDIKIDILSSQEIQANAEKNKDGVFGYLSFAPLKLGSNCAFVGLSQKTAISKTSKWLFCGNSQAIMYLYHRENGKWKKISKKTYF